MFLLQIFMITFLLQMFILIILTLSIFGEVKWKFVLLFSIFVAAVCTFVVYVLKDVLML